MRGLWLVFAAWSAVVAAGTIDERIPDARYREYGETFAAYTCRLVGKNVEGNTQVGTCTLIAPHWALTAAHVTADMAECSVLTGAGLHRIDRIFAYRDYDGSFAEHDIALVHVVRAFPNEWYPPLSDGSEQPGIVCTAAGYGVTGPISTGYVRGDGEIRAGTMRLDYTERSVWVCQIRRSGSPMPFCIAPGDSGGGLWAKAADGRVVLVGVNSYTATTAKATRSRVGEESGHTRVALYRDWIREVAGELDEPCTLASCQKSH